MKFLHLSDLHIGKQVNGFNMADDQRFVLKNVLNVLQEHQVDALVLAGDIYDKTSPSEEAVAIFDWFVTEVAALGIPCLGIPGNHDSAERIAYAQGLLSKQGLYLSPVFEGEVTCVTLADELGPVNFWLLPFLRPIDVRRQFPEAEIGNDYTAAVRTVLDACHVDPTQRNVLLSHQFVTATGTNTERADDEISLGGVDNVDVSVFHAFDYVALGHVHRAQRIGRDTVRYAGSLLKYNISEARFAKTATLVEVQEKTPGQEAGECISFQLLPLVPLHDLRQIKGPLAALMDEEVVSAGDREDYIHAVLTDKDPQIDALARLRTAYPNVMALDYENRKSDEEANAAAPVLEDVRQADPLELFDNFMADYYGLHLTNDQTQLVEQLLRESAEEIGETR